MKPNRKPNMETEQSDQVFEKGQPHYAAVLTVNVLICKGKYCK